MKIDRRALLTMAGAAAAAGAAQAHAGARIAFLHGVASGDPLQDRVILWTRVTPPAGDTGQLQGELRIGTDAGLDRKTLTKFLKVGAAADQDWTVKVDVTGLKPGTEYFYQFRFGEVASPVGRTRTLPEGRTEDVVLAVASCSLYPNGYFNAYGAIAALDRIDAVIHLGDYIYEYGAAADDYGMSSPVARERPHDPPHEIVSLGDYRRRHAQYKSDPQLQAAHARAPWIVVWDDHESTNDSFQSGAENHNPDKGEGDWATRKAAALQAYYEWMPIRRTGALPEAINRTFRFGDLASLIMVETRLTARNEPLDLQAALMVDGKPDFPGFFRKLNDPARQLMGSSQEAWLAGELSRSVKSGETWQILGNQVVMGKVYTPDLRKQMGDQAFEAMLAALPGFVRDRVAASAALAGVDVPLNLDQWDGYPAARERVFDMFRASKSRPIVLAGDSHSFWANELHDRAGALVAAEFGTTGITSPGFSDLLPQAPLGEALVARNPEVKYADSAAKGFVKLTLTRTVARAEMIAVSTILARDYSASALRTFEVKPLAGGGVSGFAS
ncbi:MAG: alkaline phosphatase D family protein [Caulobacter sp.]|nr:alkaline phosphatase D family protein [Caulobacter sp.]